VVGTGFPLLSNFVVKYFSGSTVSPGRSHHVLHHLTPSQSTHYTQERAALVSIYDAIRTIRCVSDARKLHDYLHGTGPLSISASQDQLHPSKQYPTNLFDSNNSRPRCCKCIR
jgi:hypothetical protein